MKQDISIVRGTTASYAINVTDANGDPFVLGDGQVLVFGLKKRLNDENRVLVRQIAATETGEYNLVLEPEDTAELDTGRYFYDIGLQDGASYFNIIEVSEFHIKPNVTKWGDGN